MPPIGFKGSEEDDQASRRRAGGTKMAMRTQCSLTDIAVMTPLLQGPLGKREIAKEALALVEGPAFDERVALATVDRLASFGFLRKVRSRYEVTQDGRDVLSMALQDHREALDRMTRLISPRLVDGPRSKDGRAAA